MKKEILKKLLADVKCAQLKKRKDNTEQQYESPKHILKKLLPQMPEFTEC